MFRGGSQCFSSDYSHKSCGSYVQFSNKVRSRSGPYKTAKYYVFCGKKFFNCSANSVPFRLNLYIFTQIRKTRKKTGKMKDRRKERKEEIRNGAENNCILIYQVVILRPHK
jgi:hypothetical protein